jgi:RNA-directed DNA polymerase
MKTHKNLYKKLCSEENLILAFKKARKDKNKKPSVIEFEQNLEENLKKLSHELLNFTYTPKRLRRFVIRDPKTRTIHASAFRDRVVHHAIINVLRPIYEKIFIHDSYASRLEKGTHNAVQRFKLFMRKISRNGKIIKRESNRNKIQGYVLKADIRHYFNTVDHDVMISILRRKVKDEKVIWLIRQNLDNFDCTIEGKGMPLGNYTSQFLANVYLNELDYFVKHKLKIRYYIRYVDDFVILHRRKRTLGYYQQKINRYLQCLKIELHPDKSQIMPLCNGVSFLGYRVFYHHKLLRKRNKRTFERKFERKLQQFYNGNMTKEKLVESLQGWFGYAKWANTYKLRMAVKDKIKDIDN